MSEAAHDHRFEHWPFELAVDTAAFTCVHVLTKAQPVRFVMHDADGDWQFLCGADHEASEGRLVCLGCAVSGDRALLDLSDLPEGWCAYRDSVGAEWVREEDPPESVDDA